MGLTFGLIVRWSTPVPPTWRGGIVAAGESFVSFQLKLALNVQQGLLGNWGDLVRDLVQVIRNIQLMQLKIIGYTSTLAKNQPFKPGDVCHFLVFNIPNASTNFITR